MELRVQHRPARRFEPLPLSRAPRSAAARESDLTCEIIRLNGELLRADMRALEARLTLRFTLMVIAWVAAVAVLIINR